MRSSVTSKPAGRNGPGTGRRRSLGRHVLRIVCGPRASRVRKTMAKYLDEHNWYVMVGAARAGR